MQSFIRALAAIAAGVFLSQCGKENVTKPGTEPPYGVSVELQPVDLPPPPAGMVYQAWVFRLQESGGNFSIKYYPYARFGWNSYAYKFVDPSAGTDLGYLFKASPDTTNLFTQNLTDFVRADTIAQLVEKFLRGQTVPLTGSSRNLNRMQGFLLSMEPALDPDPANPAAPFLAGYSNDSGKFEMVYPYNFRHPDFIPTYFLATPSDTLYNLRKETNPVHIQNEHRGIWFGFIDTTHYDLGLQMVRADTVLRKLARELMPDWQFEGWIERNGTRVSLGHFIRGDSADLSNPYAFVPESVFAVPGEDFLVNPPAEFAGSIQGLLGSTVMITLEPKPDPDTAMFPVILFRASTPEADSSTRSVESGIEPNLHVNFDMENRARFFPKVKVRVVPQQR